MYKSKICNLKAIFAVCSVFICISYTIFGVVNPYQRVKDNKHLVGDDWTGLFGEQRYKLAPLQEQAINGSSIDVVDIRPNRIGWPEIFDIVDSWSEKNSSEDSTRRRPDDNGSTLCHENQITAQKRVKEYCKTRSKNQTEVKHYFNSIFQKK